MGSAEVPVRVWTASNTFMTHDNQYNNISMVSGLPTSTNSPNNAAQVTRSGLYSSMLVDFSLVSLILSLRP